MGKSNSKPLTTNQAFMQCIQIGDLPKFTQLVSKWPFLVHKPVNDNLLTPLMLACLCANPQIVEILLEKYLVDVNETDFNGFTALHHCAYTNNDTTYTIAEYLCYKGIDLNIKCMSGVTALGIAYTKRDKKLIRILEYQQKYGTWARHPFHNRKKLIWISDFSIFKAIPKGIVKEICMFY